MIALGISEELSAPLIELGRIRSDFPHRVDTSLTAERVHTWLNSFSASDRAMIEKATEKTCRDLGQPVVKTAEHNPKSMFILISVFMRQVLRQIQVELDARHPIRYSSSQALHFKLELKCNPILPQTRIRLHVAVNKVIRTCSRNILCRAIQE